jgi:hypothetical protein
VKRFEAIFFGNGGGNSFPWGGQRYMEWGGGAAIISTTCTLPCRACVLVTASRSSSPFNSMWFRLALRRDKNIYMYSTYVTTSKQAQARQRRQGWCIDSAEEQAQHCLWGAFLLLGNRLSWLVPVSLLPVIKMDEASLGKNAPRPLNYPLAPPFPFPLHSQDTGCSYPRST